MTMNYPTLEPNMNDIIYAFYMTMELWIFLGILAVYMVFEPILVDKFGK